MREMTISYKARSFHRMSEKRSQVAQLPWGTEQVVPTVCPASDGRQSEFPWERCGKLSELGELAPMGRPTIASVRRAYIRAREDAKS